MEGPTNAASMQTLHDDCSLRRHAIAIRFGAVGGGNAGGVQKILRAPRYAMQRAAIVSGGNLAVGLLGLRQSQVAGERDNAVQLGIEALQAVQIRAREALRRELARFDPAR
jgi:hypothetical protein